MKRRRLAWPLFALGLSALAALGLSGGCSSPVPNRDPAGQAFPSVTGTALDERDVRLPDDLSGEPALLLVGYVMKAQFDIDRWLVGLSLARTPVRMLEVPTVKGMLPGLFAGQIDAGMQSGIPSEDWGAVVTVYGSDASTIVEWTGNEVPRNARVFLLDAQGRAIWFHDRGFSAGKLTELDARVRELAGETDSER